jgi:hypothetical protein
MYQRKATHTYIRTLVVDKGSESPWVFPVSVRIRKDQTILLHDPNWLDLFKRRVIALAT